MESQSDKNNIDTETAVTQQAEVEDKGTEKECFVIMPISDTEPYEEGHFKRVYEHLLKPACLEAGFNPIRADDVKATNLIVGDVIGKLVNADMAICDLSGRNPNVLFELGIRQAFDLPVTLIKDIKTPRIFDIQGLRDTPYDENLRVDNVKKQITDIVDALKSTFNNRTNKSNSLIHLLSLQPAPLPQGQKLDPDTSIVLAAISDINYKLAQIDRKVESNYLDPSHNIRLTAPVFCSEDDELNEKIRRLDSVISARKNPIGQKVEHSQYGLGTIVSRGLGGIIRVKFENGTEAVFDEKNNNLKPISP